MVSLTSQFRAAPSVCVRFRYLPLSAWRSGFRTQSRCRPALAQRRGVGAIIPDASRGSCRRFLASGRETAAVRRSQGGQHGRR